MGRLGTQFLHDSSDVVLLEKADGRDSCSSGFEARTGIGESDSSEGKDWDFGLAGLFELRKTCWPCAGNVFFLKYRSKNGEARAVSGCLDDFFRGMAGDSDHRWLW